MLVIIFWQHFEDIFIPLYSAKSAVISLLHFEVIQLFFLVSPKILSLSCFQVFYCVELSLYLSCWMVIHIYICGLISSINFGKILAISLPRFLLYQPRFSPSRIPDADIFNCKSCSSYVLFHPFVSVTSVWIFFQTYLPIHYFFHNCIQSLVKVKY